MVSSERTQQAGTELQSNVDSPDSPQAPMKLDVVVQARMGSRRLPGKVLRRIAGKPLLQYLLERLEHCPSAKSIVVVTSTSECDKALVEFCTNYGVACVLGSEHDVASRFLTCVQRFGLDAFVRLSGDSPLLDVQIIDRCVARFASSNADLVTNIMPRTYPRGQSVEVVRADSFSRAYHLMTEHEDLEHVTRFFYRNRDQYRIENVTWEREFDSVHLAVDTEQDLQRVTDIIGTMDQPHWQYGVDSILDRYDLSAHELTPV